MATGALDANGIWLYGEDDSEPTASALLNKLGNSISDKFDGGLPVANGGTGATTVAGAQDSLRVGLVPISPTSVAQAGGSASANTLGKVTFSTITSLSLNGVFTSAYENYRIILNMYSPSASSSTFFRMRASGVDATSAIYNYVFAVATPSTLARVYQTNQDKAEVCYSTINNQSSTVFDIFYPALARTTYGIRNSAYVSSGAEWAGGNFIHSTNTAYDGFSILQGAGNVTGTIQVFGYNE